MTPSRSVRIAALIGACLAAGPATGPATAPATAPAAGPAVVDNPLYAGWAKWKVGSTATYVVDGGRTITSELTAVTAEAVTVSTAVDGQSRRSVRTIPARVAAAVVVAQGQARDVASLGRARSCRVVELTSVADGESGDARLTECLADDVVGGVVTVSAVDTDHVTTTVSLTRSDAK